MSVDGIAPRDVHELGGRNSQGGKGKTDADRKTVDEDEWQEGIFEEMKGQRLKA